MYGYWKYHELYLHYKVLAESFGERANMKGKKLKYYIIGLGIIIAGGLLVSLLYNSYNKKTHENQADMLIQYLENLMRIELKD